MKQRFLNSTISFLKSQQSFDLKDEKKLLYGLEGIYLTITKLIVIIGIALILGILKEVLIVMILFNVIRYFGFGFHAEKSSECLFLSIINFVLIPFFFIKVDISLSTSLIISGACIVSFLIFAPADTVKRPLKDKKKRLIRKILTVTTGLVYTGIMLFFNNQYISSLVVSSLLIMAIVISPITYKIFRQPYNNYKNIK